MFSNDNYLRMMKCLPLMIMAICIDRFAAAAQLEDIVIPPAIEEYSLSVAFDCLGSLSLYAMGRRELLARAVHDAGALGKLVLTDDLGRRGWGKEQVHSEAWGKKFAKCGSPGSITSFDDNRCNPANTSYMIQTGYGLACLAQLSIATGSDKYLKLAEDIASDSWGIGISPSSASDTFYYWYSYDSHDFGIYPRNTNAIMGLGMAWLYAATGNDRYRNRALAISRAEHREISTGNFGYYGIDDNRHNINPSLEKQRIENHIPHQAKALKDIGTLLGDSTAFIDSKVMLDSFIDCNNKVICRPRNCKDWAVPIECKGTMTIAPCILADRGEPYRSRCESVLKVISRLSAFQIFLRYSPSDAADLRPR